MQGNNENKMKPPTAPYVNCGAANNQCNANNPTSSNLNGKQQQQQQQMTIPGSMKPSLSMTSLPPTNGQQDFSEIAKLRLERPYNSLKKKRNSERDIWRNSWGSGHSHSSCSLHSTTAGSGKDDFWAALQPNYNFIMDTNLLDCCKEACCEIEGAHQPEIKTDNCCEKMDGEVSRTQGSLGDLRSLRRWLREMENRISTSPSLTEAMRMTVHELEKRAEEHSSLYLEIVTKAKVVSACIRIASESNSSPSTAICPTNNSVKPSTSTDLPTNAATSSVPEHHRIFVRSTSNGNLKALEKRYHLLYLRAIEVQCLLEGLLGRKDSPVPPSYTTSDTDEEPAAKLARLNDFNTEEENSNKNCDYFDASRSDDEWCNVDGYIHNSALIDNQTTGFDADSEGSDCEVPTKHTISSNSNSPGTSIRCTSVLNQNIDETMMDTTDTDQNGNISIDTSIISVVTANNISSVTPVVATPTILKSNSPTILSTTTIQQPKQIIVAAAAAAAAAASASASAPAKKRPRQIPDSSKFNKSNRKSKNCATFYFKHLDTDNENTKDWSSQTSEAFKSGTSSESEEWFFSNGIKKDSENNILMNSTLNDNELDINFNNSNNNNVPVNISSLINENNSQSVDIVDSSQIQNKTIMENNHKCNGSSENLSRTQYGTSGNLNTIQKQENSNYPSTMINGTSSKNCYSKETIHQLVLDAETLVREEILSKSPKRGGHRKYSDVAPINSSSLLTELKSINQSNNVISGKIMSDPKIKRVEEWLKHQPLSSNVSVSSVLLSSTPTTDCEASGEYTESDSAARDSDTSEGLTDSVATYLQDQQSNSQCTSTEIITVGGGGAGGGGTGIPNGLINIHDSTDQITSLITTSNKESISGVNQQQHNGKVKMRTNRRNSDRPWSVSCISQLQKSGKTNRSSEQIINQGLANHSISESALHTLSTPKSVGVTKMSSDSKNSLKRRRMRSRKKLGGRKSESGSNGSEPNFELSRIINQTLVKSESFSGQANLAQDLSMALSLLSIPHKILPSSSIPTLVKTPTNESIVITGVLPSEISPIVISTPLATTTNAIITAASSATAAAAASTATTLYTPECNDDDSDEENVMMKPNFQLGAYTTMLGCDPILNLGSLAALTNYNREKDAKDLSLTGTEDTSNLSEQAWDNYQEKYLSEQYSSEGFDSDAARRLLEFGDDYRNFIDSQSDCCSSSLSAANNFDSLSPPRNRRFTITPDSKSSSKSPSGEETVRRRRVIEHFYDRRRKGSDGSSKKIDDNRKSLGLDISATTTAVLSSTKQKSPKSSKTNINRKLEYDFQVNHSSDSFLNGTDSLNNPQFQHQKLPALQQQNTLPYHIQQNDQQQQQHQQHSQYQSINNRRRIRSKEKILSTFSSSSSSSSSCCSENEDDTEIQSLLVQSRNRLEHTDALRVRSHLLRSEDYTEIISTCRENIQSLESILRGIGSNSNLSIIRCPEIKELLSSWESLLHWNENASVARQLQEEMAALKDVLNKMGTNAIILDSESSIQLSIDELKHEKTQLYTQRSTMLRLNASVHSWLTRQEMKRNKAQKLAEITQATAAGAAATATIITTKTTTTRAVKSTNDDVTNNSRIVEQFEPIVEKTVQVSTVPLAEIKNEFFDCAVQSSTSDIDCVDEELHNHLKGEVSELYRSWDEANARISARLDTLTTSLIAWKQFESGLSEFKEALGKDKGTLKGLTGALDMGNIDGDLTLNVKEVAKRLSEKNDSNNHNSLHNQQHQQENNVTTVESNLYLNPITAMPFGLKASSNGSLSDSGISDGGGSSDYGLQEREKRLGSLRRLARQLESALAPGSAALQSIAQRMEAAEADLRSLQDTCRDLIIRTTASQQQQQQQQQQHQQHHQHQQQQDEAQLQQDKGQLQKDDHNKITTIDQSNQSESTINYPIPIINFKGKPLKRSPQSKRKTRRRTNGNYINGINDNLQSHPLSSNHHRQQHQMKSSKILSVSAPSEPDPNDPNINCSNDNDGNKTTDKKHWLHRLTKYAIPAQIALIALFCIIRYFESKCCDSMNNFSSGLQLHYVNGPPPT